MNPTAKTREIRRFLVSLCGDVNKASSRVRGYWVAEELEADGRTCTLHHRQDKLSLLRFLVSIPFHDVIVFQKTYSRWHLGLLNLANVLGKFTVLDFDDAPSRTNSPVTLRNIERMMNSASLVTVGSQNLFDYASEHQSNVTLIPSSVKLSNYQVKRNNGDSAPVCLGWIGNGRHYQQDLVQILGPVVTRLADKHRIRLKIVGACGEPLLYETFSNIPGLQADFIDQLDWSSGDAIAEATSDFDIGLYPLLHNGFNDFKCGFKALEYMASGIPVVSSNVAINSAIVAHEESGYMVEGEDEWSIALERLIQSPDLRQRMGNTGREIVEQRYDVRLAAKSLVSSIQQTMLHSYSPISET